jgi:tRNA uridine 5-carboxymethylaminomethyl modification enzyme
VRLVESSYTPKQVAEAGIRVNQDGTRRSGLEVLAFPDIGFDDLLTLDPMLAEVDDEVRRQLEREALYVNYLSRQEKDIEALRRDEERVIPADFNYSVIDGLSNELKLKLNRARPENLAQAARVDGMTPAALALLLTRLRRDPQVKSA